MKQNQDNQDSRKPCPNCGLPIQQGEHWSENFCYTALQDRIAQLEQELQQQHAQTINLLAHIAHAQQSEIRHNFTVLNFQFGKANLAIRIGNTSEAFNAGKTLASAGIEVLKYLGLWELDQKETGLWTNS